MIIFNLLTPTRKEAEQVCELILRKKFALHAFIDEAIDEYIMEDNEIIHIQLVRVICITKAMLFHDIEQAIHLHFIGNDFRYYATPVTQVDNKEAERMRKELPKS
jgi:hypothetical protein